MAAKPDRFAAPREVKWLLYAVSVVFVVLFGAYHLRRDNTEMGLAILGDAKPSAIGYGFEVIVMNTSSRNISYRVSYPQTKYDGSWTELWAPEYYKSPYSPISPIPSQILAPGQTCTNFISEPRNINARVDEGLATAWRVAVIWRYSSPNRWEELQAKAETFLRGKRPALRDGVRTNFCNEIKM